MEGRVTHTCRSSPAFPPEMLSPTHLPAQSPSLNAEDIKPKGQNASHHSVGPQKAHELDLAESPQDSPTRQLTRGCPKATERAPSADTQKCQGWNHLCVPTEGGQEAELMATEREETRKKFLVLPSQIMIKQKNISFLEREDEERERVHTDPVTRQTFPETPRRKRRNRGICHNSWQTLRLHLARDAGRRPDSHTQPLPKPCRPLGLREETCHRRAQGPATALENSARGHAHPSARPLPLGLGLGSEKALVGSGGKDAESPLISEEPPQRCYHGNHSPFCSN